MQKDSEENNPAQSIRNQEPRGDGNTVKKCMDDESQQHGISFVRMHELIFVGLFAKVEVRRDRMLEEVNDEVAEQN